jgi:hypothetical protein
LESKLLTPGDAFVMWKRFCDAISIEKAKACYGAYWPRTPEVNEIVWKWMDGDNWIGWSAIRKDILESVVWLIFGIMPEYQGNSYSKEIFRFTIKQAFTLFGNTEWVFAAISKRNPNYLNSHLKQMVDSKWVIAGEMDKPEPYIIFGLERN